MDREKQFAQILAKTLRTARTQHNYITKAQIEEAFAPLQFNEAQTHEIEAYFAERKITVADVLPEKADTAAEDTPEKEALFQAVLSGDTTAKHKLIEHYMPMVKDIARLYEEQGVFTDDLIGEGNLALVTGVDLIGAVETAFEAEQALSGMIMNAMEDLVRRTLKEKADDEKTLNRVREVADKAQELAGEYRRDLTVAEIMDETGWDETFITDVLRLTAGGMDGIETPS